MTTIKTLDWLKKEAEAIAGHWNGSDTTYTDGNGELRTDDDAQAARELLDKLKEVDALVEELGI